MSLKLAMCVFLLVVSPAAGKAQTPDLELQCPETAAGFELQGMRDGQCEYLRPLGDHAAVSRLADRASAPAGPGAARLDTPAPEPFSGAAYHLGETEEGDQRLVLWNAGTGVGGISIRAEYVIPRTTRGDITQFAGVIAEANGLSSGREADNAIQCPAPPQDFTLAERLTGQEAGAAVRWSCAYLNGDVFAFFYAPRDPALVVPTFEEQLSPETYQAGPFPGMGGAERLVFDKGVYRGVWLTGEGADARALELDWVSEADRESAAALVRRLIG